jgi:hypothetical protein
MGQKIEDEGRLPLAFTMSLATREVEQYQAHLLKVLCSITDTRLKIMLKRVTPDGHSDKPRL